MSSRFKLALIQLSVGANKSDNLIRAANKISEAVSKGANIVSLPGKARPHVVPLLIFLLLLSECFNSPYGTQYFKEYAESVPDGASCEALKNAAIKNKVGLSALFNFTVVHVLIYLKGVPHWWIHS